MARKDRLPAWEEPGTPATLLGSGGGGGGRGPIIISSASQPDIPKKKKREQLIKRIRSMLFNPFRRFAR